MNSEHWLKMGLWITPMVLQPLIAAAMIRGRLLDRFTFFFVYCLFAPARDAMLLLLQQHPNSYSWVYWAGEGVSIILQLLILREVCLYVIQPYSTLRGKLNTILHAIAVLAAALAGWIFYAAVAAGGNQLIDTILLAERSARFLQVAMLLGAIIAFAHMGLDWKGHECGIILGSGIAGLQLVPAELRSSLHAISDTTFSFLMPAVYDCAVLAWAVHFLRRQKPSSSWLPVSQTDMGRWNDVLKQYLLRK